MFNFPLHLYTDVRIEDVYETHLQIQDDKLKQNKQRHYQGAFIRIYDGQRWYYSATTRINALQEEIDHLAKMATPNPHISSNPIITRLEVNTGQYITYPSPASDISNDTKLTLLNPYIEYLQSESHVSTWSAIYLDNRKVKSIYSSKGTNLTFDTQSVGLVMKYSLNVNGKLFDHAWQKASDSFDFLSSCLDSFKSTLVRDIDFISRAVPVAPGQYTVIFSPTATGVFTHESFGHKSESDLMLGSESMKNEWALGKQVGTDILSIIDRGDLHGSGFVPFDDEGNKARVNYIIKEGILTGRLHSSFTASELDESITGNARAMNFEYEPIVRMTNTYIDKGSLSKEDLIAGVEDGIYIEDIRHGSGMSTFTIAPSVSYRVRQGKIAEPVTISVVTGSVMETLYNIDGISDTVEILSFVSGGCGKMEQWPLPVGFGGPYIRVKNINVQ